MGQQLGMVEVLQAGADKDFLPPPYGIPAMTALPDSGEWQWQVSTHALGEHGCHPRLWSTC
jgi:hypothetical protein